MPHAGFTIPTAKCYSPDFPVAERFLDVRETYFREDVNDFIECIRADIRNPVGVVITLLPGIYLPTVRGEVPFLGKAGVEPVEELQAGQGARRRLLQGP